MASRLKLYVTAWMCCFLFLPGLSARKTFKADTVTLISFNDFHGYFVKDAVAPGASALVRSVLEEKAASPHPFVVSGGDNFSGSFFSRMTKGEPLPEMFRLMGVTVSAVGNHEFDWGKEYLQSNSTKDMTYVAANIEAESECGQSWLPAYKILSCTLKNGAPFRIAFIGLTTVETQYKTSAENVAGLRFVHPYAAAAIQLAYHLKKEGKIDMAVLLCHVGTDMRVPGRFQECDTKMLPYMEGVNAIITAHSHKVVLDEINGVPVIQAGSYGRYLGKLQFKVTPVRKSDTFRVEYIGGDTIPVDRDKRHAGMEEYVEKYTKQYRFDEVLTLAEDDILRDSRTYSVMGGLVTASYVACFKKNMPADSCSLPIIGVNHAGGIRNDLYRGGIDRMEAANILPFAGQLVAYRFTGKMLRKLLDDGWNNPNGRLQACCLDVRMKGNTVCAAEYVAGGKAVAIGDDEECIVVLDDYITDGGDQYDSSLFVRPVVSFNKKGLVTTDAFIDYLKSKPSIRRSDVPAARIVRVD